ncbi:MAG: SCO family protein [Saprospiraceae bacterium]
MTCINWGFRCVVFLIFMFLMSCKSSVYSPMPYLGPTTIENGEEVKHQVKDFSHYNQDSVLITDDSMKNYIYVADFFFTSCPSICPRVAKEMQKIYQAFEKDPTVKLVSFTIDPKRDNVHRLKLYADNLGVKSDKWYFLTGDKDATFELANSYFLVAALEDPEAPGGFDHSGKIILVDKHGHLRSFCEGTDPSTTPKMIEDIRMLSQAYRNGDEK